MGEMFCRQCEQTAKGTACTISGVCGKNPEVAALQDLLIHSLKSIAIYGDKARELGAKDENVDLFLMKALFVSVTNVNFDPNILAEMIYESSKIKENVKTLFFEAYRKKKGKSFQGTLPGVAAWNPGRSLGELIEQGKKSSLIKQARGTSDDISSLREIILYGLKGMAAYADHAFILGKKDEKVSAFFYKGLAAISDADLNTDDLLDLTMQLGKVNLRCMEMLDQAHTEKFGDPVPTKVLLGTKPGPAIIISGHDLYDLEQLLEQTKGTGINIYTHGEMLPAHGYPGLKKYDHLAGHFGSAWQNQQKEFNNIPAAILFTTNCIQKPLDSYKDRVFTTGLVAWPGIKHVPEVRGKKDFTSVIKKAKELPGFEDEKEKEITVGFAHNTVLNIADKVITAIKEKKVRHIFLIGGCDGAKPGRNYYTEFAEKVPKDCIIVTLACGKFRINRLDLGDIGGLPRLLDCGQCNDAYSAIKIASSLANTFGLSVNDLPLSFVLSWYEQKAVCILLTLLSLGVKGIRLGPSLPAFISPDVLDLLVKKFDIRPISTPEKDLKEMLDPS